MYTCTSTITITSCYMLAQIEGELNAPDRAVEGLVGEFGDDGSGVGSSSFLPLDDDFDCYSQTCTFAHDECFVSRCFLLINK